MSCFEKSSRRAQLEPDLEFNLELLAFLVQGGDEKVFIGLVRQTIPLLQSEEDFQDLLTICADFYHLLDHELVEQKIQDILKKRSRIPFEKTIDLKDPDFMELFKAMVR